MKKKKKSTIYKKNHAHRVNHILIKKVLQGVFLCSIFFFIFSLLLTIKTVTYNEEPLIKTKQVLGATNLSSLLTDAEASPSADQFIPNFLLPTEASSSSSATSSALPLPTTPTPTIPLPENTIFNGNDFCLSVPVILYHHVEPLNLAQQEGHAQLTVDSSIFDEQMAYLAQNGYNTISAEQLVAALLSHQQLPKKSIVVTLDDGYVDWYDYAFPVAKKYNVTLNLMIPAGLITNNDYLNWSQLKEMAASPYIKVYNHTWSHADIGNADKSKIEFEITSSQNELQSELGSKINIFTYPYGSFSPLAIEVLREHGFIAAFTTLGGSTQCDSSLMTLHRDHIGNAPMSAYGF